MQVLWFISIVEVKKICHPMMMLPTYAREQAADKRDLFRGTGGDV